MQPNHKCFTKAISTHNDANLQIKLFSSTFLIRRLETDQFKQHMLRIR